MRKKKEKPAKEVQGSIKSKLMAMMMGICAGFALTISVLGYHTVFSSMRTQTEREMKAVVSTARGTYDTKYPGEFDIQLLEDGRYIVYKGRVDMTEDYSTIDNIKSDFGYEVSLFCRNIRVQTTLTDHDGQRLLATKAATKVDQDVLDGGHATFYRDVTIEDIHHFAYYEPIVLKDGTIYGMIGVCCSADEVRRGAFQAVLPLTGISFLLAIGLGLLSWFYTGSITRRLQALQSFMKLVAQGNFGAELPIALVRSRDELGLLAKDAKKMQRAIQLLVDYDGLTQLFNRRCGEKKMRQLLQRAEDTGGVYCVAMADIDFFKRVNDHYGHEAGDAVLRAVAKICKKHMAGRGCAIRWGGEEFLMLLDGAGLEQGIDEMEALLADIRSCRIVYGKQEIKLTMSMGIVQGDGQSSADVILRQADHLLYYAKTHGRNQLCHDLSVLRES